MLFRVVHVTKSLQDPLEVGNSLVAQLTPLPLTVFCFSKIQIGFAILIPAHPGRLGKRAVKPVCYSLLFPLFITIHSNVNTCFFILTCFIIR